MLAQSTYRFDEKIDHLQDSLNVYLRRNQTRRRPHAFRSFAYRKRAKSDRNVVFSDAVDPQVIKPVAALASVVDLDRASKKRRSVLHAG